MASQSTLLNYKILRVLGKGGMGTVYLARHAQINRLVAIKELKPQFARDRSIRERFKNEAALMANLSHPNIVSLHDYIEMPSGVYLVMEYVEGTTLDHFIHRVSGPVPENRAIDIFVQILEAFHYAHQRNIVHRDIKPSNIMLTPQGAIKILDFGIAKNIRPGERDLTQTGTRMGTIYYMSPEQIRAQDLDTRSDIYNLGITLFEMLTGRNPYYQEHLSEYDISEMIVKKPLPQAKNYYPNINPRIQKILEKATAKDPNERFQNVLEFRDALLNTESGQAQKTPESNTVEWVIESQKNPSEMKSVKTDSIKIEEPITEKESEYEIFHNSFGTLTNHKVSYYRGRDLFERGKKDQLALKKIEEVTLDTHREIFTGVFFLIIAIVPLIFFFRYFTLFFAMLFSTFGLLCFTEFPTITIIRKDQKRLKMRAWPWHNRRATEFVRRLNNQLRWF